MFWGNAGFCVALLLPAVGFAEVPGETAPAEVPAAPGEAETPLGNTPLAGDSQPGEDAAPVGEATTTGEATEAAVPKDAVAPDADESESALPAPNEAGSLAFRLLIGAGGAYGITGFQGALELSHSRLIHSAAGVSVGPVFSGQGETFEVDLGWAVVLGFRVGSRHSAFLDLSFGTVQLEEWERGNTEAGWRTLVGPAAALGYQLRLETFTLRAGLEVSASLLPEEAVRRRWVVGPYFGGGPTF